MSLQQAYFEAINIIVLRDREIQNLKEEIEALKKKAS